MPTIPKANRVGGYLPMAGGRARSFGRPMKTHHNAREKHRGVREQRPAPEPLEWKKAGPPRLAGRNSSRPGEWRPGEQAHRGYEKAVEEWWWI